MTKNSTHKSPNCRPSSVRSRKAALDKTRRAVKNKYRRLQSLKFRRAAEGDLKIFVRAAWPILEPTTRLQWNWHLDLLCDHLVAVKNGERRRLIINVPPRSMKSLLCTVFYPIWRWTTEPQRRFMFVSYSDELSTDHSVFRRNVLTSRMYRDHWGDKVKLARGQNLKTQYENTQRGVMFSTSITGSATGKGCDELIVDDPLNAQEAFSDKERDTSNRNFDATFRSRLNNPATGAIIIVMQRLHDDDLSGHVLNREPGAWTHIKLPAEFEEDASFQVNGHTRECKAGDLLWPERFPREVLEAMKVALGSWSYSGQYQQNPAPFEGSIIKREWIHFYSELPTTSADGSPIKSSRWIQSWDCSFKDTSESDYVVGQVWLRIDSSYYLVDQVRARMDFVRTAQAIRQMTAKYPQATAKLIEDKANGPAVIRALRTEVDGMIPWSPTGSKTGRLYSVSPLFQAGNVLLPEPSKAPWVGDFVEELTRFPKSVNDDQVDACTQALLYIQRQTSGVIEYYRQLAEQARRG